MAESIVEENSLIPHIDEPTLTALARDELTDNERRQIQRHLRSCDLCRTRVALRLGSSHVLVEDRPFFVQLIQEWMNIRRFLAGLVVLAMMAGISTPILYMYLRLDQRASGHRQLGPAEPSRRPVTATVPIRRVGAKTFYFVRGIWIDSAFDAQTYPRLIPCSLTQTSGQDLLKRVPQLRTYAHLDAPVIVVVENNAYWIFR
ncbi:MAG: zf-HC2 domain-containing protein [Acidobacteria bacterium]|nr:MAG: zf-HC2 domain-containing protein [Acidobacteriota bacterium]